MPALGGYAEYPHIGSHGPQSRRQRGRRGCAAQGNLRGVRRICPYTPRREEPNVSKKIQVGDKVRSQECPEIGVMTVLYVEPDEEVRKGCSPIVTVSLPNGDMDDTDLSDLERVE